MRIIHVLPDNSNACGGIRIHLEFALLAARKFNVKVYSVFLPNIPDLRWMYEYYDFRDNLIFLSQDEINLLDFSEPTILIGYEDPKPLQLFDNYHNIVAKICFIQNGFYVDPKADYTGIDLWFTNDWTYNKYINEHGDVPRKILLPFINTSLYYPKPAIERIILKNTPIIDLEIDAVPTPPKLHVLISSRKGGDIFFNNLRPHLKSSVMNRCHFTILPEVEEEEYAATLRNHDIFLSHLREEGNPLIPLEALSVGTVVVGFPGGGGAEYLNESNSFLADQDNLVQVAEILYNIVSGKISKQTIAHVIESGIETVQERFVIDKSNYEQLISGYIDASI